MLLKFPTKNSKSVGRNAQMETMEKVLTPIILFRTYIPQKTGSKLKSRENVDGIDQKSSYIHSLRLYLDRRRIYLSRRRLNLARRRFFSLDSGQRLYLSQRRHRSTARFDLASQRFRNLNRRRLKLACS